MEASNTKLDNILLQAEKDHSELVEEMKSREAIVENTNRKLGQINDETQELKEKTAKLERECSKSQAEYKTTCENLEATINKNKDLTGQLKGIEHNLRGTENELDQSVLKRESLRKDHMDLVGENKVLNAEIDKTLVTIIEY